MKAEPTWLTAEQFITAALEAIPELRLLRHDLLMSALDAPYNAYQFGGEDNVYTLAGVYAQRVAKAHAFADCNKRCALIAAISFLLLNDVPCDTADEALATFIVDLARGVAEPKEFQSLFN